MLTCCTASRIWMSEMTLEKDDSGVTLLGLQAFIVLHFVLFFQAVSCDLFLLTLLALNPKHFQTADDDLFQGGRSTPSPPGI